jgi:hypothetical protein
VEPLQKLAPVGLVPEHDHDVVALRGGDARLDERVELLEGIAGLAQPRRQRLDEAVLAIRKRRVPEQLVDVGHVEPRGLDVEIGLVEHLSELVEIPRSLGLIVVQEDVRLLLLRLVQVDDGNLEAVVFPAVNVVENRDALMPGDDVARPLVPDRRRQNADLLDPGLELCRALWR